MKNQFPTFGRSKVLFSLMLPPELADPVIIIMQHYPWGVLLPAMSIKTNALAVAPMLCYRKFFLGGLLTTLRQRCVACMVMLYSTII
jgi:hypothetical protein